MRMYIVCLTLLFSKFSNAQQLDSLTFYKKILPIYYADTGAYLPEASFMDINGYKKSLKDFKGKIVYLDIWATWCGACIMNFPYHEQLQKRLKHAGLDTIVKIVNINFDEKKRDWQQALKKHQPAGINLYSADTSLYSKWNLSSIPAYIILDETGKVLGKDIAGPGEASIDWILYCASKNIHPAEALKRHFEQSSLMAAQKSSKAFTDEEFASWFQMMLPSFLEFNQWRMEHRKGTGSK
jgi:thiol-disulfide isomerase/thioredoxin